jgi:hypothetical protein
MHIMLRAGGAEQPMAMTVATCGEYRLLTDHDRGRAIAKEAAR